PQFHSSLSWQMSDHPWSPKFCGNFPYTHHDPVSDDRIQIYGKNTLSISFICRLWGSLFQRCLCSWRLQRRWLRRRWLLRRWLPRRRLRRIRWIRRDAHEWKFHTRWRNIRFRHGTGCPYVECSHVFGQCNLWYSYGAGGEYRIRYICRIRARIVETGGV